MLTSECNVSPGSGLYCLTRRESAGLVGRLIVRPRSTRVTLSLQHVCTQNQRFKQKTHTIYIPSCAMDDSPYRYWIMIWLAYRSIEGNEGGVYL